MPIKFQIDQEADLVLTQAFGEVSAQDLADHARALAATHPRPSRELADFSCRTTITVSADAVRSAAWYLSDAEPANPGSRLALVGSEDAVYAMLRLFQAHRANPGLQIQVFRDRDAALEWLERAAPSDPS